MKREKMIGLLMFVWMAGIAGAQPQGRTAENRECRLMDQELTQEQKDKIEALRTAHWKDVQADRNQLNELKARKRTLETADPVDKKALMDNLEAINKIRLELDKKSIRHRQQVKSVLTEEQMVWFDAGAGRNTLAPGHGQGSRGRQHGKANMNCTCALNDGSARAEERRGRGRGQGNGPGYGRHQGPKREHQRLNLSEEQQSYIENSRQKLMAGTQGLKNQLDELRAKRKSLCTGRNVDLKAVDKLLDAEARIRLDMDRMKAEHQLDVRHQLDDRQKILFDNKRGR